MKKSIILFILILNTVLLSSCWDKSEASWTKEQNNLICEKTFSINWLNSSSLDLKAKVIAENFKNIISNNWWNIEYLNCMKWQKVTKSTLIAKIKPDYNDPNIQNLVNQSNTIKSQISNTKEIIVSTKSNFQTQLNSLNNQKLNLENQLNILNDSYEKIWEQKDFWVSDIDKQLDTLQIQLDTIDTQITDLNNSKSKLEESKKSDTDKLNSNLINSKTQAKSLIWDTLLKIDEIFWISKENDDKNDTYEDFLSAKNILLKNEVEQEWINLNNEFKNYSNLSNDELSKYLQELDILSAKSKDAMKNSVSSANNFTQQTIDNYYNIFLQYENSIVTIKNWLDNIIKSIDTVKNTYDTQILSLTTQINWSENSKKSILSNIDNIKSNKLWTYTTSLELQKNQTMSQIQSAESNISTIWSQISSLLSQEQIQLNQLSNQLTQLQSSLNTININLSPQTIYAETNWTIKEKVGTVWNKVWPNSMICQILPDESSLKLQVYSSYDLPLPIDITFTQDDKTYKTKIVSKLSYQDSVTQNFIYETSSDILLDEDKINITDILSEWKTLDIKLTTKNNLSISDKIYIPINFVSNTISWSKVKTKQSDWSVKEKDVILWELDLNNIEIRSWLNFWDIICN